jgi:hypothetical protein
MIQRRLYNICEPVNKNRLEPANILLALVKMQLVNVIKGKELTL